MSTAYYRLREPITSLRLVEGQGHDVLRVWENHGFAGELIVSHGAGRELARMFAVTDVDDAHCPLHIWYGGEARGVVVDVNDPELPDDRVVVAEDGDVTTVGTVKALAGQKASHP